MSVGYDKHALNNQIVLDLKMEEMGGTITHCCAQSDIVATLHGVGLAWAQLASGLPYLDLAATPDWLDAPQADTTGLDFTVGDFSMMVLARLDVLANGYLMVRGLANTDGWLMMVGNTGRLTFATCQGGLTQTTTSWNDIEAATWYLLGMSRAGTMVRLYINGRDRTDAADVHASPLTSNRELHIGIHNDEATDPWDGGMHRPRAWSRYLQPREHMEAWRMVEQMLP